jgi:hypothetical protein
MNRRAKVVGGLVKDTGLGMRQKGERVVAETADGSV